MRPRMKNTACAMAQLVFYIVHIPSALNDMIKIFGL